jgi:hypothetical protein
MGNSEYKRVRARNHNMRRAETAADLEDRVRFPRFNARNHSMSGRHRRIRTALLVCGALSSGIGEA